MFMRRKTKTRIHLEFYFEGKVHIQFGRRPKKTAGEDGWKNSEQEEDVLSTQPVGQQQQHRGVQPGDVWNY